VPKKRVEFIAENGGGAGVRMKKGEIELRFWLTGLRICLLECKSNPICY
jgi:hypothetical protein